jgi:hypothetical protein
MFKSRFIRDSRGSTVGRIDDDYHCSLSYDVRGSYVGRYDRKFDRSYYRKLWIDDVMKKAAYPSA